MDLVQLSDEVLADCGGAAELATRAWVPGDGRALGRGHGWAVSWCSAVSRAAKHEPLSGPVKVEWGGRAGSCSLCRAWTQRRCPGRRCDARGDGTSAENGR